jgi:hypothetical protein
LLDTLLLINRALVNSNPGGRPGDLPIVLVIVDRITCAIFAGVKHRTITSSKLATVPSPHSLFLGGNRPLLPVQPLCFARSQCARVDALLDTLLLIGRSLVYFNTRSGPSNLRQSGRSNQKTET